MPVGSGVGSDVGTDVGTSVGFGTGMLVGDLVVSSAFEIAASSSTLYQRREPMVLVVLACRPRTGQRPGQRLA